MGTDTWKVLISFGNVTINFAFRTDMSNIFTVNDDEKIIVHIEGTCSCFGEVCARCSKIIVYGTITSYSKEEKGLRVDVKTDPGAVELLARFMRNLNVAGTAETISLLILGNSTYDMINGTVEGTYVGMTITALVEPKFCIENNGCVWLSPYASMLNGKPNKINVN